MREKIRRGFQHVSSWHREEERPRKGFVRRTFIGKRSGGRLVELGLVLSHEVRVDLDFRRSERGRGNELEVRVADELAREPEERSLEVVVRLGRDLEVLKVLLAVERDSSRLDFSLLFADQVRQHKDTKRKKRSTLLSPISLPKSTGFPYLDIDLVTAEDDGDVLADTLEITVPVGNVLVRDFRRDVEHDDTTLSLTLGASAQVDLLSSSRTRRVKRTDLDVVTVTETSELFLSSRVPHVEADGTEVGVESQRVNLDTESS